MTGGAPHRTKRQVLKLMREISRNHLGSVRYDELIDAATNTLALSGTHRVLKDEVPMLIELIETYVDQIAQVEALMVEALDRTPEARYLLSIPGVAPVTAAVFLGSIGDPSAYESSKQVLRRLWSAPAVCSKARSALANAAGRCSDATPTFSLHEASGRTGSSGVRGALRS